jgi:DNA mismatch repair protein MutH
MSIKDMIRPTIQEVYTSAQNIINKPYYLPKNKNKGNHGGFLENLTGIPNSTACLDCSDGEVKTFPIKINKNGELVPKESIAVTMISKDIENNTPFLESKVYKKLSKTVFIPYTREDEYIKYLEPVIIDLNNIENRELFEIIKNDYEEIQKYYLINETLNGSSKLGKYLQNRTKGPGKQVIKTRAFYLRSQFITDILLKSQKI